MKKQYTIAFVVLVGLIILFFYFKDEKVYTSKYYNSKTKTTEISEYVIRNGKTIFQGKFTKKNDKGIKIAEGQFKNDEPNGVFSYYYDDGKIESVYYRKNSKVNLECTYYNPNGLLDKYIMCDDFGKTSFIISFDEKGPKQYNGFFLLEIYQYKFAHKKQYNMKTEQVLKVGDVLKYHYLLANIPNAKRSFKIENISIDNTKVKRTITKKAPTSIIVEEVLTKKGLNRIKAITQYKFNDKVTPAINDPPLVLVCNEYLLTGRGKTKLLQRGLLKKINSYVFDN
jgi:hypothetical protein